MTGSWYNVAIKEQNDALRSGLIPSLGKAVVSGVSYNTGVLSGWPEESTSEAQTQYQVSQMSHTSLRSLG